MQQELSLPMPERGRVLVVEDDESIAQFVVDVLRDERYTVRRASNGHEGLSMLTAWHPDVIVLDLMMPVMDGRAFRQAQFALDGGVERIPVIVLSGAREARAAAEELRAAAALTKPFDIDQLLSTIDSLLSAPT